MARRPERALAIAWANVVLPVPLVPTISICGASSGRSFTIVSHSRTESVRTVTGAGEVGASFGGAIAGGGRVAGGDGAGALGDAWAATGNVRCCARRNE